MAEAPADSRGSNGVERERCWDRFRAVMDAAAATGERLEVDEIVERSRAGGGRGVSRRTLMREPYRAVVRAQSPNGARGGEMAGIPERIRILGPRGMAERILELEQRLREAEGAITERTTASLRAGLAELVGAATGPASSGPPARKKRAAGTPGRSPRGPRRRREPAPRGTGSS